MSEHRGLDQAYIFHITTRDNWGEVAERDTYASPSLEQEGYIHCSRAEQVERSLNRFFNGEESVIVLTIDPALLTSELKYETADGDRFPHIYGELNVKAVVAVEYVERNGDGGFHYPAKK